VCQKTELEPNLNDRFTALSITVHTHTHTHTTSHKNKKRLLDRYTYILLLVWLVSILLIFCGWLSRGFIIVTGGCTNIMNNNNSHDRRGRSMGNGSSRGSGGGGSGGSGRRGRPIFQRRPRRQRQTQPRQRSPASSVSQSYLAASLACCVSDVTDYYYYSDWSSNTTTTASATSTTTMSFDVLPPHDMMTTMFMMVGPVTSSPPPTPPAQFVSSISSHQVVEQQQPQSWTRGTVPETTTIVSLSLSSSSSSSSSSVTTTSRETTTTSATTTTTVHKNQQQQQQQQQAVATTVSSPLVASSSSSSSLSLSLPIVSSQDGSERQITPLMDTDSSNVSMAPNTTTPLLTVPMSDSQDVAEVSDRSSSSSSSSSSSRSSSTVGQDTEQQQRQHYTSHSMTRSTSSDRSTAATMMMTPTTGMIQPSNYDEHYQSPSDLMCSMERETTIPLQQQQQQQQQQQLQCHDHHHHYPVTLTSSDRNSTAVTMTTPTTVMIIQADYDESPPDLSTKEQEAILQQDHHHHHHHHHVSPTNSDRSTAAIMTLSTTTTTTTTIQPDKPSPPDLGTKEQEMIRQYHPVSPTHSDRSTAATMTLSPTTTTTIIQPEMVGVVAAAATLVQENVGAVDLRSRTNCDLNPGADPSTVVATILSIPPNAPTEVLVVVVAARTTPFHDKDHDEDEDDDLSSCASSSNSTPTPTVTSTSTTAVSPCKVPTIQEGMRNVPSSSDPRLNSPRCVMTTTTTTPTLAMMMMTTSLMTPGEDNMEIGALTPVPIQEWQDSTEQIVVSSPCPSPSTSPIMVSPSASPLVTQKVPCSSPRPLVSQTEMEAGPFSPTPVKKYQDMEQIVAAVSPGPASPFVTQKEMETGPFSPVPIQKNWHYNPSEVVEQAIPLPSELLMMTLPDYMCVDTTFEQEIESVTTTVNKKASMPSKAPIWIRTRSTKKKSRIFHRKDRQLEQITSGLHSIDDDDDKPTTLTSKRLSKKAAVVVASVPSRNIVPKREAPERKKIQIPSIFLTTTTSTKKPPSGTTPKNQSMTVSRLGLKVEEKTIGCSPKTASLTTTLIKDFAPIPFVPSSTRAQEMNKIESPETPIASSSRRGLLTTEPTSFLKTSSPSVSNPATVGGTPGRHKQQHPTILLENINRFASRPNNPNGGEDLPPVKPKKSLPPTNSLALPPQPPLQQQRSSKSIHCAPQMTTPTSPLEGRETVKQNASPTTTMTKIQATPAIKDNTVPIPLACSTEGIYVHQVRSPSTPKTSTSTLMVMTVSKLSKKSFPAFLSPTRIRRPGSKQHLTTILRKTSRLARGKSLAPVKPKESQPPAAKSGFLPQPLRRSGKSISWGPAEYHVYEAPSSSCSDDDDDSDKTRLGGKPPPLKRKKILRSVTSRRRCSGTSSSFSKTRRNDALTQALSSAETHNWLEQARHKRQQGRWRRYNLESVIEHGFKSKTLLSTLATYHGGSPSSDANDGILRDPSRHYPCYQEEEKKDDRSIHRQVFETPDGVEVMDPLLYGWKFTLANVVCITDARVSTILKCQIRQPIPSPTVSPTTAIYPALLHPAMVQRHERDLVTLTEEPHLVTTHTILVVLDLTSARATRALYRTGSNEQAGQDSSSTVAESCKPQESSQDLTTLYGILARDIIAEQLYQQPDAGRRNRKGQLPGGAATATSDVVSVIESTGGQDPRRVVDRQPLDWALYNSLLQRASAPGNAGTSMTEETRNDVELNPPPYMNDDGESHIVGKAIQCLASTIFKDVERLEPSSRRSRQGRSGSGNCDLSREDMPAYLVLFLILSPSVQKVVSLSEKDLLTPSATVVPAADCSFHTRNAAVAEKSNTSNTTHNKKKKEYSYMAMQRLSQMLQWKLTLWGIGLSSSSSSSSSTSSACTQVASVSPSAVTLDTNEDWQNLASMIRVAKQHHARGTFGTGACSVNFLSGIGSKVSVKLSALRKRVLSAETMITPTLPNMRNVLVTETIPYRYKSEIHDKNLTLEGNRCKGRWTDKGLEASDDASSLVSTTSSFCSSGNDSSAHPTDEEDKDTATSLPCVDDYLEEWKVSEFQNATSIGLEVQLEPFARGRRRATFMVHEANTKGRPVGRPMVTKRPILKLSQGGGAGSAGDDDVRFGVRSPSVVSSPFTLEHCTYHARIHAMAMRLALQFNKVVSDLQHPIPRGRGQTPPPIFEIASSHVHRHDDGEFGVAAAQYVWAEEYLFGTYIRFTPRCVPSDDDNDHDDDDAEASCPPRNKNTPLFPMALMTTASMGHQDRSTLSTPVAAPRIGRGFDNHGQDKSQIFIADWAQAFSHWTYEHCRQELVLCNLRGVVILAEKDKAGADTKAAIRPPNNSSFPSLPPRVILTCPTICCKGRYRRGQFDATATTTTTSTKYSGTGTPNWYGPEDGNLRGLRQFRREHSCNQACVLLGLCK
jgi:hypothetical protein